MKEKGFTLIELLAVIVILAVIILIATPIILNVIEKTRERAAESSASGYVDAVEKTIAINAIDSSKTPIVDNSYTTDELKTYGVTVKGQGPEDNSNSWVLIEKGRVKDYSLKIGDYVVNYDGTLKTVKVTDLTTPSQQPASSIPLAVSFADDSWATIAAAVKSGNYPYNVGDTKTVDMGSLGTHTVRVANKTQCTNGETSETACGFVVEFTDIIYRNKMNTSATNVGGWETSKMRVYVNNDIYNALPSDLQGVIADTIVVSGHSKTSEKNNFTTQDKLYLLSAQEIWGSNSNDTSVGTSRQLDYYANLGVTASNYTGTVKQYNGDSYWWLRSASSTSTSNFLCVGNRVLINTSANTTRGVSPAFRIA